VGTSAWLATASERPLIDDKRRTFTFVHLRKGLYMPIGTMQAAGGSLDWLRGVLAGGGPGQLETLPDDYEAINRGVARIPPGSDNLLFLPYLLGERSPWWNPNARGAFLGLTMLHTREHLVRAVMEGVAFNMKLVADCFAEQGRTFPFLRIIAGGSKSAIWRQIFADVLERPIATLNFADEATAAGAAMAAGVGVGLFPSIEAAARIVRIETKTEPAPSALPAYRTLYPLFVEAYERVAPLFDSLAARHDAS